MTDIPDFDLDAALSAELDGDLDGYIADEELPGAAVRRALDDPAAQPRRAALERARGALQDPVSPLNDVARRRLLGSAKDAAGTPTRDDSATEVSSPTGWSGRLGFTRLAAAAVAGIVLIGGVAVLANRSGGGDAASKSASRASADATHSTAIPTGDLGDLGVLTDTDIDALAGAPSAVGGGAADSNADASGSTQTTPAQPPNGQASNAERSVAPSAALRAKSGVAPDQVGACRDRYAKAGGVRFTASVRYQDRPAVVVGIAVSSRTVVLVVAAEDCGNVLYSASTSG